MSWMKRVYSLLHLFVYWMLHEDYCCEWCSLGITWYKCCAKLEVIIQCLFHYNISRTKFHSSKVVIHPFSWGSAVTNRFRDKLHQESSLARPERWVLRSPAPLSNFSSFQNRLFSSHALAPSFSLSFATDLTQFGAVLAELNRFFLVPFGKHIGDLRFESRGCRNLWPCSKFRF